MKTKHLKLFLTALAGILGIQLSLIAPTFADDVCSNPNLPPEVLNSAGCGNNKNALPTIITNILYVIIGVAGLVAVIYIIIGGINYMTSAGDTSKLEKAKKTILYACIGLIICALAFAIVNWTIGAMN